MCAHTRIHTHMCVLNIHTHTHTPQLLQSQLKSLDMKVWELTKKDRTHTHMHTHKQTNTQVTTMSARQERMEATLSQVSQVTWPFHSTAIDTHDKNIFVPCIKLNYSHHHWSYKSTSTTATSTRPSGPGRRSATARGHKAQATKHSTAKDIRNEHRSHSQVAMITTTGCSALRYDGSYIHTQHTHARARTGLRGWS